MDGRAQKLRRLKEFRRSLPHISANALSSVLATIDEQGVPDRHSRKDFMNATHAELEVSVCRKCIAHTRSYKKIRRTYM